LGDFKTNFLVPMATILINNWDIYSWHRLVHTFVWLSMAYLGPPHEVLVWESGLGGVLDMNGMGLWNPSHDWRKYDKFLH